MKDHRALFLVVAFALHGVGLAWAAGPQREPGPREPAIEAKDLPTTRISIASTQMSAREVFASIGKQANVEFDDSGRVWDSAQMQRPLVLEFKDLPFWAATMQAADKAGLIHSTSRFHVSMPVAKVFMQPTTSPADHPYCLAGPFLISMETIIGLRSRDFTSSPMPLPDHIRVSMQVTPDPHDRICAERQIAVIDEAVDDTGQSLLLDERPIGGHSFVLSGDLLPANTERGHWWQTGQTLLWLRQSKTLARLRGWTEARVVTKTGQWEIDLTDGKDASKQIDGITYTAKLVRKTAENRPVRYEVEFIAKGNMPRSGVEMPLLDGTLVFADGSSRHGSPPIRGGMDNARTQFGFGEKDKGEPTKVIYEYIIETQRVKTPFEFKDLPLP